MKKLTALLIGVALLLGMTACGSKPAAQEAPAIVRADSGQCPTG